MVGVVVARHGAQIGQAGTLRRRVGERVQAVDGGVELGPGTELFHRLGGVEQQVEGGVGVAARELDGHRAQIAG